MAGLFWDLSKLRRDFYNINSTLMVASAHMHACVRKNYCVLLELRQYKNNFVSVKRMLDLKLSPFSPCHGHVGEGKRAAISKQTCFSVFTEASPFLYCLLSSSISTTCNNIRFSLA